MPSDKDRLYFALYARSAGAKMPGKEDTYHWALIIGPKEETNETRGMRYHAKDRPTGPGTFQWMYEEIDITTMPTNMLLVRALIGKVKDMKRLEASLRDVPVVQGDAAWNCVIWARKALEKLQADGKTRGTSQLDWQVVRDAAMKYVREKKEQHRFDGQAPDGTFDT